VKNCRVHLWTKKDVLLLRYNTQNKRLRPLNGFIQESRVLVSYSIRQAWFHTFDSIRYMMMWAMMCEFLATSNESFQTSFWSYDEQMAYWSFNFDSMNGTSIDSIVILHLSWTMKITNDRLIRTFIWKQKWLFTSPWITYTMSTTINHSSSKSRMIHSAIFQ
jgi:hypothetical protein